MSVIAAALITLFSVLMLSSHLSQRGMMKLCGYAAVVDVVLHVSVIYVFIGTSTLGLMQAELSACLFTACIRGYRFFIGYSRLVRRGPVVPAHLRGVRRFFARVKALMRSKLVWSHHYAPKRIPSFLRRG